MGLGFYNDAVEYLDRENSTSKIYYYDNDFLNNILTLDNSLIKSIEIIHGFSRITKNYDVVIKFIVGLLEDSNCSIKTIEFYSGLQIHEIYLYDIFSAIIKNKTIETIYLYGAKTTTFVWNEICESLEKCNNIKNMEIGSNFNKILMMGKLPKNLESLRIQYISDSLLVLPYIKNYKLKKLIVNKWTYKIPILQIASEIKNNRTLLHIDWPGYEGELLNDVTNRNGDALTRAITAAKTLLMIRNRKYSRNECDINLWIPKEIIVVIAKYVKESYDDPKWHEHKIKQINNDSTIITYGIVGIIGLFFIYSFFKR